MSWPVVLSAALAACSTGVTRHDDPDRRAAYFAGGGKVASDVSLSLNDTAKGKLADNLGFDHDRLLAAVKRAMDARGLLAKAPGVAAPSIEIIVTDIRVRSNFSAVMFGFMANNDSITGDVIARDITGKEVQRFQVSASYALGGLAGGQDATRMEWLYNAFAAEMIKELTGTAP
jgi:hypothetical protein